MYRAHVENHVKQVQRSENPTWQIKKIKKCEKMRKNAKKTLLVHRSIVFELLTISTFLISLVASS